MEEKVKWELVSTVLTQAKRVLLYGPPGTGKTFAGMRLGLKERQKVYAVTVTPDMPMSEVRGHYIPRGDKWTWQDGPFIRAWRQGSRLVINEIGLASEDIMTLCLGICDDPDFATYTLPTSEIIKPHPDFQVIATTNNDPNELLPALRDRFPVCIELLRPNPEAIKALPKDLRELAENSREISIRCWLEFARLRERMDVNSAAFAVFGNRGNELVNALKISASK